jgi:trimeric autotransporter adhesin
MKKLSYVILALLTCLIIAPAMAASLNSVSPGGDVFLGEQGLILNGFGNTSTTFVWFSPGNDIVTSAPSATRTINPLQFYVSPSDYSTYLGNWYLQGNISAGSSPAFVVRDPTISVQIRDGNDNNVDSKSVTSGTKITFRIESNLNTVPTQRGVPNGFSNIRVRSPDGTTYTALSTGNGTLSLVDRSIDNSPYYWVNPGNGWDTAATSGGNKIYKAGVYTVWIESNLNGMKDNYNVQGKTISAEKTVTIATDTLQLSTSKDSVTRGQGFAITVTGRPSVAYNLFVKNVGSENAPTISGDQEGVVLNSGTNANVTTSTSGTRTVGFQTNKDTKDKTWTIRVEGLGKSDELTVKVGQGSVTIASPGSQTYFLGDEIKFTGTNSETDTVFLFLTGPNLPGAGGKLTDPRVAVVNNDGSTFATADVDSNNAYTYKWDTSQLSVDSGSYTVYAVSSPKNRDNLNDAQYATISITLKKPFISAEMPGLVAAGDKITIKGDAGAKTSAGVAVWIFGKNFVLYKTASVEDDGKFKCELSSGDTANLASGQYFVVVQHPMYNNEFDVYPANDTTTVRGAYPVSGTLKFRIAGSSSLQGSDAANALVAAINDPAVDDVYCQLNFEVGNPFINIESIPQKMVGDTFTLRGTTNLAVDDEILVDIYSSSFTATNKSQSNAFSGTSKSVKVIKGPSSTTNTFSLDISTASFKPDEYLVSASGITNAVSGQAKFVVVPYVAPTPTPTPPTPVPTTIVTTIPTANMTPIPTATTPAKSPGFGSIVALAGLGVVAFLVVKRK